MRLADGAHRFGSLALTASADTLRSLAAEFESASRTWVAPPEQFEGRWSFDRAVRLAESAYVAALKDVASAFARTVELRRIDGGPALPLRHRVLEELSYGSEGVRPSMLAERLDVPSESVSRALRELTESGLVVRNRRNEHADRRAVLYSLTDEGHDELLHFRELGPLPLPKPGRTIRADKRQAARDIVALAARARRSDGDSSRYTGDLVRVRKAARDNEDLELFSDSAGELVAAARRRNDLQAAALHLQEFGRQVTGIVDAAPDTPVARRAAARYHYERARLAEADQDRTAASAALDECVRLLGSDTGGQSRLLRGLCHETASGFLWVRGDLVGALYQARAAVGEMLPTGDEFAIAHSSAHLAFCARLVGRFDEATLSLNRLEDVVNAGRWPYQKAKLALHRGEVLRYRGRPGEAVPFLKAAVDLFNDHSSARGAVCATSAVGACEWDAGNTAAAIDAFTTAGKQARSAGLGEEEVLALRRLGTAEATSNPTAAAAALENAAELYGTTVPSPVGRLEALTALAAAVPQNPKFLESAVAALAELPDLLASVVSDSVGSPADDFRLVDVWVYSTLRKQTSSARASLDEAVRSSWSALIERRWAGRPNVRAGRSAMSKEPLTVRR